VNKTAKEGGVLNLKFVHRAWACEFLKKTALYKCNKKKEQNSTK
jgi:hypothetical protein